MRLQACWRRRVSCQTGLHRPQVGGLHLHPPVLLLQAPRQHRLPLEAQRQPRRLPEAAAQPDRHQDPRHLQREKYERRTGSDITHLPGGFTHTHTHTSANTRRLRSPTSASAGAGYLDDVSLVTARRAPGVPARWVERCTCPQGYQGQQCERCTLGYRRARPELGAFSACEPCSCNGHSESCDPDTGPGRRCPPRPARPACWLTASPLSVQERVTARTTQPA